MRIEDDRLEKQAVQDFAPVLKLVGVFVLVFVGGFSQGLLLCQAYESMKKNFE